MEELVKIIGSLDYSIASPGVCKFILDDNLNVVQKDYLSFTQSKKFEKKDNIIYYKKDQFKDHYERIIWIKDYIFNFLNGCDYIALEGYAFGASGRVFDIAEGCGLIKTELYETGHKLRLYDPPSIKKYATGMGNSDKIHMEEDYEKIDINNRFNLNFLPFVKDNKSGNPKDNIVDAYFIGQLLILELKVRHGIILLKDLNPKIIEIFNKVSNHYKDNLLVREFIEKRKDVNQA